MLLIIHRPVPPLNKFIDHIIYYKNYNPVHTKERLLPDGAIEIIIDLTDEPKFIFDNNDLREKTTVKKAWVSGMRKEYITIQAAHQSMMVIRFKAGRTFPFFDFPLNKLMNCVIPVEDVWNGEFKSLRERLVEEADAYKAINLMEKYLIKISCGRLNPNPFIDYSMCSILNSNNSVEIKALSKEVGYSHKHFIHLFEKHVGISPKYYYRIMRFQKILQKFEENTAINWAQFAAECGYYDQAHFINEFKKFAGLSPSNYLNERGEYLNYIPID